MESSRIQARTKRPDAELTVIANIVINSTVINLTVVTNIVIDLTVVAITNIVINLLKQGTSTYGNKHITPARPVEIGNERKSSRSQAWNRQSCQAARRHR